jgi:hypothetical protein
MSIFNNDNKELGEKYLFTKTKISKNLCDMAWAHFLWKGGVITKRNGINIGLQGYHLLDIKFWFEKNLVFRMAAALKKIFF